MSPNTPNCTSNSLGAVVLAGFVAGVVAACFDWAGSEVGFAGGAAGSGLVLTICPPVFSADTAGAGVILAAGATGSLPGTGGGGGVTEAGSAVGSGTVGGDDIEET